MLTKFSIIDASRQKKCFFYKKTKLNIIRFIIGHKKGIGRKGKKSKREKREREKEREKDRGRKREIEREKENRTMTS